jgi:hypothetical protein
MFCRDMRIRAPLALLILLCGLPLAGCDQLGIETPAKIEAAREAEGRAVGGACRHSGRALEDCYILNPKAHKASVYAGWRDMDAYMRENNIEVVPSVVPKTASHIKKKENAPATDEPPAKSEEAPPKKAPAHSAAEPALPAPTAGRKSA